MKPAVRFSPIAPVLLAAVVLVAGCGDSPSDDSTDDAAGDRAALTGTGSSDNTPGTATQSDTTTPRKPRPWTPSPDAKVASFLGLEGPKPVTWIEHPPSRLHCIRTYILPGRDGNPQAHINVFYLGPRSGGTVNANLAMWAEQFRTPEGDPIVPRVQQIEVDGMAVTIAQYIGDYMPKSARYFQSDREMIVSIVESPQGVVFIELLGVTATVNLHRDNYLKMIQGLQRADKDETEAG